VRSNGRNVSSAFPKVGGNTSSCPTKTVRYSVIIKAGHLQASGGEDLIGMRHDTRGMQAHIVIWIGVGLNASSPHDFRNMKISKKTLAAVSEGKDAEGLRGQYVETEGLNDDGGCSIRGIKDRIPYSTKFSNTKISRTLVKAEADVDLTKATSLHGGGYIDETDNVGLEIKASEVVVDKR
jgi:hypothetical protein